jgi:hypothetical protein
MTDLQPRSQESERIGSGLTLGITAWVLVFGVALCVVAGLVLTARSRALRHASSLPAPVRPEPEVSQIRTELFGSPGAGERLKAEQRSALQHYTWVDREHGIVRIPIDVAMELEVQGTSPWKP